MQSDAHPRFLGLDIGSRRIGVAVSDELGLTAQPVMTLSAAAVVARICARWRGSAGASAWWV